MMGIVDFEHIMLDISAVALATSGPFLHRASQIQYDQLTTIY